METTTFSGVITALVTPFLNDNSLDINGLINLMESQIKTDVQGFVVMGTTGEAPNLSKNEKLQAIQVVVSSVSRVKPVIVGVGSNSTALTVDNVRQAEGLGVDAFLIVAPYYNKPTQEGLFAHYEQIAESTRKPIILYSHPGRTGIEVGIDVICRLHEKHPHICALKDVGGSCDRITKLRAQLGDSFSILSGDDSITLPFLSVGANGVISVISNAFPEVFSAMVNYALHGDLYHSRMIHQKMFPLMTQLASLSTNPIPIKCLLAQMGIIESEDVRLPLCKLSECDRKKIQQVLADFSENKKNLTEVLPHA